MGNHGEVEQPPFSVQAEIGRGVVTVTVHGELDLETREQLVDVVVDAVSRADHGTLLEIDLRDVSFADSSGLTALVRCCRLTPGRRVALVEPRPAIVGPLVRTGLDALFELRPPPTSTSLIDLTDEPQRGTAR